MQPLSNPPLQIFTLRELSQLDVYGTWAVLRNQLTTDDSFQFNKVAGSTNSGDVPRFLCQITVYYRQNQHRYLAVSVRQTPALSAPSGQAWKVFWSVLGDQVRALLELICVWWQVVWTRKEVVVKAQTLLWWLVGGRDVEGEADRAGCSWCSGCLPKVLSSDNLVC